jgi:hypothetical protein
MVKTITKNIADARNRLLDRDYDPPGRPPVRLLNRRGPPEPVLAVFCGACGVQSITQFGNVSGKLGEQRQADRVEPDRRIAHGRGGGAMLSLIR